MSCSRHDFTGQSAEPCVDYNHVGEWGGFLHGHNCCGKCKGNFRCVNACGGVCGNPRQTGTKYYRYCVGCGKKAAD